MNIKLITYEASDNGISLQILPETDIEIAILRGLFKHGKLKIGHPCSAKGSTGFYVNWTLKIEDKPTDTTTEHREDHNPE